MIDKAGPRQYVKSMRLRIRQLWWILFLALVLLPATGAAAAGDLEANHGRGGETLDLQSVRVKGKTTVIEFYSPFCPPCLQLAPLLVELAQKRPELAIKKLNINRPEVTGIDWKSPLAQQYHLRSVPHFVIFNPQGKATEGRAATQQVLDWLQAAGLIKE
jgi:thioredoxin 1